MLTVAPARLDGGVDDTTGASVSLLDELVREGARRMLAAALEAEVGAYVDAHTGEVDENVGGWWSATATTPHGGS